MNVQIASQSGVGKTVNVYLTYLLVFGDKPVYLNLSMYVLYIHMHICTHFEIMSVGRSVGIPIIYYTSAWSVRAGRSPVENPSIN